MQEATGKELFLQLEDLRNSQVEVISGTGSRKAGHLQSGLRAQKASSGRTAAADLLGACMGKWRHFFGWTVRYMKRRVGKMLKSGAMAGLWGVES